jgi:hypothetical protein
MVTSIGEIYPIDDLMATNGYFGTSDHHQMEASGKRKHCKVGIECYSLMAHRVFGKIAIFFSFVGPSRPMANFCDKSFAKKIIICVIVSRWMCGM